MIEPSGRQRERASFLSIDEITVRFGGILALDGLTMALAEGEILGLIGPNGAGKTTVFNCLSGLVRPASGDISVGGRSLIGQPLHWIAAAGLARTFQHGALFPTMTVRENLLTGCHLLARCSLVSDALHLGPYRKTGRKMRPVVDGLIERFDLATCADRPVRQLPFGLRKRVELARALAAAPSILLLDEPAGGLNEQEVGDLARLIRELRDRDGISVLIVEHHMGLVLDVADRMIVLNFGRKIAEGAPREVLREADVVNAYLGEEAA